MKNILFDSHNILSIEPSSFGYNKEYSFCFSGYWIKSKEKEVFVYNKRNRRILNFKEIGLGMQICYLQERVIWNTEFDFSMVENVLSMYQGFNEQTGEKYHYLPFFSGDEKVLEMNFFEGFGVRVEIQKRSKGTFLNGINHVFCFPIEISSCLSLIFLLVVIYGKFEEKNGEFFGIKAHIPIIGGIQLIEQLENMFINLSGKYGIFVTSQTIKTGFKKVFQFSSNDVDLLELFVKWRNKYLNTNLKMENYLEKQQKIKDQLVDFLVGNGELSFLGKEDVLEKIENYRLKFIKCVG